MTDVEELRRLAPPSPRGGSPSSAERDAALARIISTPRRSKRRRVVRRVAVSGLAVAALASGVGVWVSGHESQGVRISLDGQGTSAVPPTGGPAVEVDIAVAPAPGVSLARDALLDRAEKVLKERGVALSIDGFAVRRGSENHLVVTVPRAEDDAAGSRVAFAVSPGFAVYSGDQIVRSGTSYLDVVEKLVRMRGSVPGSWFAIRDTGQGRNYKPQAAIGPFSSQADAAGAFAGLGFTTREGRPLARTRTVRIPKGLSVVSISGLPPDGRHRGERNGYYAVRGAPALTGEDLDHVGAPGTRSAILTRSGADRLARLFERIRPLARRGKQPDAFAVVGGAGSNLDLVRSASDRLVLKEPYAKWRRRVRPVDSILASKVGLTDLFVLNGGAAAIQTRPVGIRQVGRLPQRIGTPVRKVPAVVNRAIQGELRLGGVRQPVCCTVRSLPRTLLEMVRVPRSSEPDIRLLTTMRTDGTEGSFVVGDNITQFLTPLRCGLPADSPALQPCAYYQRGPGARSKALIMMGRAARDVVSVVGVDGRGRTHQGAVANGWFLIVGPPRPSLTEVVALDATGKVIGRSRLSWLPGVGSIAP